jgi:hypothetical protein
VGKKEVSNSGWKRLFNTNDCHYLPLFIAASSGFRDSVEAYKNSASMTQWLIDQFKKAIPMSAKESPESYASFLHAFIREIPKIIAAMKSDKTPSRESIVRLVFSVLKNASKGHKERTDASMFIAHQIVADLEELLSHDVDSYSTPFQGDFVWPGYGGKSGFSVIDHELLLKERCVGSGYKRWNPVRSPFLFLKVCLVLEIHMEEELSDLEICLLGLKRLSNGRLVIKMTNRYLSVTDIEHMLCKVYLAGGRSRGSRNQSISRTWRNYCWPSRRQDTVGCPHIHSIVDETILAKFEEVVAGFASLLDANVEGTGLTPLEHPFTHI